MPKAQTQREEETVDVIKMVDETQHGLGADTVEAYLIKVFSPRVQRALTTRHPLNVGLRSECSPEHTGDR